MSLLLSIKQFSKRRLSWSLLLLFTLFFEGSALFFQHVMHLDPCVMCVYERVSMLGIIIGALIGLINPKHFTFFWMGMVIWAASSAKGLSLAIEHVSIQLHPSIFNTCSLVPEFPSWLQLNQWFPWIFSASGECSKISWQFLTLSMPQWLIVIFAGNLIAIAIIFLSQFAKKSELSLR
ncbi:disulfide bond formation protein DsbB [Vibrio marisflavi]|uniref:Disulfide bond formation protein B n=1 Tax=Vibrio marisflavi CECT 7928 TaxID=634439 RepID=A0ABM9A7K7_9VIBR|nr:disulfide bond formation protein DsbB [Vibrio marisflavi]CAH0540668.1 Disulfide bond formation protein B [Vibrio marisflavi CECT 7928]